MERYTAQVLIGECRLCNGGLIPEYQIFLWENENPVLTLQELHSDREWLWFPGRESMVDDIFLMISSVILEEIDIKALEHLSLLDEYTEKERYDYYELVREKSQYWNKKVILNLFRNSLLENQLEHLKDYGCNMEVTTTRYLKESDGSGNSNEEGYL